MKPPKKTTKTLPSEKLFTILEMIHFCARAVGAGIADPEFRVNIITYTVGSFITLFLIFSVYTAFKLAADDWTVLLEIFCLVPASLQGLGKFVAGLLHARDISGTVTLLKNLYSDYENRGEEYKNILYESCDRQRNIIKLFILIYIISIGGILSVPFIMMLAANERHLMMNFHLPGIDISTNFGYFFTLGFHTICVLVGAFGLFAGDLYMLILSVQNFLYVDILKLKVKELNTCVHRDKIAARPMLHDIVRWHQLYTNYNESINRILAIVFTTAVGTSGASLLFSMITLLTRDWPGVYAYIVLATTTLYAYCIIGTQIEICNDRFCDEIYNIAWYYFEPSQEKLIVQMLIRAQNPALMVVAGVLPLSVSTALSITKTVYTFMMILMQFMEAEG